jgi:hypothetical protein
VIGLSIGGEEMITMTPGRTGVEMTARGLGIRNGRERGAATGGDHDRRIAVEIDLSVIETETEMLTVRGAEMDDAMSPDGATAIAGEK